MSQPESVTTARAAEIVGIGYEGLRSLLKRGFLKNAGALAPFSAPEAKAEELYVKRWTWTKFGPSSLCLMRLGKLLMDAGLSFDSANSIVGRQDMWDRFAHGSADEFLVVTHGGDYYYLYPSSDAEKLQKALREYNGATVVISLETVQRHVADEVSRGSEASVV